MNICKILSEKPAGTPLYTTLWGDVELVGVHDDQFEVREVANGNYHWFRSDGKRCPNGECVIFPSKHQRDWGTPFSDYVTPLQRRGYVTFEQAKLLKAAHFPQESGTTYDDKGNLYTTRSEIVTEAFCAPTREQAVRWLRAKDVEIYTYEPFSSPYRRLFISRVEMYIGEENCVAGEFFADTPERSEEQAITAACKYLIGREAAKNKNTNTKITKIRKL